MPDFAGLELTRLKATPGTEAVDRALEELVQAASRARAGHRGPRRPAGRHADGRFRRLGRRRAVPRRRRDRHAGRAGRRRVHPRLLRRDGGHAARRAAAGRRSPSPRRTTPPTWPGKPPASTSPPSRCSRRKPAALDDALAQKLGFENIEEVRDVITRQMQREYDSLTRMRIKRDLLDALAAGASFPVPQTMVDGEFNAIWQRVEADLKDGQGRRGGQGQGRGDAQGRIPRDRRAAGAARPAAVRDRPRPTASRSRPTR